MQIDVIERHDSGCIAWYQGREREGSPPFCIYFYSDVGRLLESHSLTTGRFDEVVIHKDLVFLRDRKGQIYCFTNSGKMLWMHSLPKRIVRLQIVASGVLVACSDGHIYALSFKGELLWNHKIPSKAIPVDLITSDDREVIAYRTSQYISVVDKNGKLRWRWKPKESVTLDKDDESEIHFIIVEGNSIKGAAITKDGSRIYTISTDNRMRCFESSTKKVLHCLNLKQHDTRGLQMHHLKDAELTLLYDGYLISIVDYNNQMFTFPVREDERLSLRGIDTHSKMVLFVNESVKEFREHLFLYDFDGNLVSQIRFKDGIKAVHMQNSRVCVNSHNKIIDLLMINS